MNHTKYFDIRNMWTKVMHTFSKYSCVGQHRLYTTQGRVQNVEELMSRRHSRLEAGNGRGVLAIIDGSTKYPSRVISINPKQEWVIRSRARLLQLIPKFEALCANQTLLVEAASDLVRRRRR